MPVDPYSLLKSVIEAKPAKAIKARYLDEEEDPRELWPHVLGKNSTTGHDVVFCFQGVGPENKCFRCFRVDGLIFDEDDEPFNPTGWHAKKFNVKDVIGQNCVTFDEVDVYR